VARAAIDAAPAIAMAALAALGAGLIGTARDTILRS
jgi:hypothetical protein